ncbi:hypothetical protein Pmani_027077 [Petrolisthes manimaculis]|uniref:Uncharacterized protein n=1 Tax=Petrolisthes manimaculis TaxID=1843537 RepID=A0AAE1TZG2_9EUCA|nr:hypothetical protein Pmani_027077 [Petrolisthes manimaculis]
MAVSMFKALSLLSCLVPFLGVSGQAFTYDPYFSTSVQPVLPHTQTVTHTTLVTDTHTLRASTTSDVWVTEVTSLVVTGTQYSTTWDFVPTQPRTYTSIVRITSTPVTFVTATVMINSRMTETSAFTTFFTNVETVDLVQSITHIAISHQVHTRPVISTQVLHQTIITTVTQLLTATVTSTTRYG